MGKILFLILSFPLSSRAAQIESVNTNGIKRDIHLACALFWLGNIMYLLVQLSSFTETICAKL